MFKVRRALPPIVLMMVAVIAWFVPASEAKNVGQLRDRSSRNGVAMAPEPNSPQEPQSDPAPDSPSTSLDGPAPADPETPSSNPGAADPEATVPDLQPEAGGIDETPGAANDAGGTQEENGTAAPAEDTPLEISPEVQAAADEAVANIFDEPVSVADLGNAVTDLVEAADTPEEIAALVGSLLDQDLSEEQFAAVADSVFVDNLSDENFGAALDAFLPIHSLMNSFPVFWILY